MRVLAQDFSRLKVPICTLSKGTPTPAGDEVYNINIPKVQVGAHAWPSTCLSFTGQVLLIKQVILYHMLFHFFDNPQNSIR
jgi:hypothetical protein